MEATLGTIGALFLIGLLCLGLYGCPQYNVYTSRMSGEADLAHATYSKQVAVQTAQAKLDASKLEAQTDAIRAQGVANANKDFSGKPWRPRRLSSMEIYRDA